MSIKDIKSIIRIADQELDRLNATVDVDRQQIVYLSDKLSKVFHALRKFQDFHGREMDAETLDALNLAWRNHESSFDVWLSYQKSGIQNPSNDFDIE